MRLPRCALKGMLVVLTLGLEEKSLASQVS